MPIYNAADDIIRAFQAGRQMKQAREDEARAVEDRQIEKDLLKHRLAQMATEQKLQTWQRSRAAQLQNVDLMSGQPQASYPDSAIEGLRGARDLSSVMAGFPGQPGPSVPVAANQPLPLKPVTIPGFADYGVSDVQVRPQTLEQQIAARIADARLKEAMTVRPPVSVPRGGSLVDPRTGRVIAKGQPVPDTSGAADARQQRGIDAVNTRLDRADAAKQAAIKQAALVRKSAALAALEKEYRNPKIDPFSGKAAAQMGLDTLNDGKLRIHNAYLSEIGEPEVDSLPAAWSRGSKKPPEASQSKTKTLAPGSTQPVSVTTPGGVVFRFPTQQQADAFKKAAGIK